MTIILFVIILAVLIFVHELGHFVAAKLFGIRVDEFALGFPPRIASFKYGETTYALNLIPFGGYVKIFGEDSTEAVDANEKRSLAHAARWKQVVILLSGITMNFIFAWLLLSLSFHVGILSEVDAVTTPSANAAVTITSILPSSPAQVAGMQPGDKLLSMSEGSTTLAVISPMQVQQFIETSKDAVSFLYLRANATGTAFVTATSGIVKNEKAIGISMDILGTVQFGVGESLLRGGELLVSETHDVCTGIIALGASLFHGDRSILSQLAGPVGIESMVGQAQAFGLSNLFGFVALISINLAVLNLIPFPVFDGGRVVVILIEGVIRKPIKPTIIQWINLVCFALLILLMVFVTYQDIARLIH